MSLKGVLGLILSVMLCACAERELTMSDGKAEPLSKYQGQWLFVNYWAVWCKPCVEEIPELNALDKHKNITVLAYNFDNNKGVLLDNQASKLGIDFAMLGHDPADVFGQTHPGVLPATMLISPEGQFQEWLLGPQTEAKLLAKIN